MDKDELDALPQDGEVVASRYRVQTYLDDGAFGVVVLAEQINLRRFVALKLMRRQGSAEADEAFEARKQRFLREPVLLAAVQHRNVVSVFDTGVDEKYGPWFAMEVAAGTTLSMFLEQHRRDNDRLAPHVACQIVDEILAGLAAIHDRGIVHRDIQPANIAVVTDDAAASPTVVILDFGVARSPNSSFTGDELVPMHRIYAAPEQGNGTGDKRSDLYSVAAIFCELLSGRPPRTLVRGRLARYARALGFLLPPITPPEFVAGPERRPLPNAARTLLEKALNPEPELRYQDARSMRHDLRPLLQRASWIDTLSFPYRSEYTSSTLVPVEPGSFAMGSPIVEVFRKADEDQHQVTTTKQLLVSRTLVTLGEYAALTGQSRLLSIDKEAARLPATNVSWFDAVDFCNRLSQYHNLPEAYTIAGMNVTCNWESEGYRLPTEAEWEFLAGGGVTCQERKPFAGGCESELFGWFSDNSDGRLQKVALKQPSSCGLFDMLGLVWEWVWDWYGPYGLETVRDPTGPAKGTRRVCRGGSWRRPARWARIANRGTAPPSTTVDWVGFRLVRVSSGAA